MLPPKTEQDFCPPEVELSKAVDYLESNSHRIRDWNLLQDTIARLVKHVPGTELAKQLSRPRIIA